LLSEPNRYRSLDILAISKDKKSLSVAELKKGRARDVVVGQALRYLGDVQDDLVAAWAKRQGRYHRTR
jgi:hypothetical protein